MALINELSNTANVVFDGVTTLTNAVVTLLQLPPVLLKAVDKTLGVKLGDTLLYTVTITNPNLSAMTNVQFNDPLPAGCSYVDGSCKVNGSTVAATYTAGTRTLSHTIASIAALGIATITFQVRVDESEDNT